MFMAYERPEGKFVIGTKEIPFPLTFGGSLNVLPARLLNLTYPDYLRLCRGQFGAELYGKEGYSYPVFSTEPRELISILNRIYRLIPSEIWSTYKENSDNLEWNCLSNGINVRITNIDFS